MRAGWLALVSLVAGCDGLYAEDDDGAYTDVHITSPTAFDRLEVFLTDSGSSGGRFGAPRTPEMFATGEPLPGGVVVAESSSRPLGWEYTFDPPRTSFDLHEWELTETYALVLVAGYAGDTPLGGDAAKPVYDYGQSALHAKLTLALGEHVELFGSDPQCARVAKVENQLTMGYYVVRYDDADCDGTPNAQDCQPAQTCAADVPGSCDCP